MTTSEKEKKNSCLNDLVTKGDRIRTDRLSRHACVPHSSTCMDVAGYTYCTSKQADKQGRENQRSFFTFFLATNHPLPHALQWRIQRIQRLCRCRAQAFTKSVLWPLALMYRGVFCPVFGTCPRIRYSKTFCPGDSSRKEGLRATGYGPGSRI